MSENVNLCEYIESKCVHVEADCFDLEQIMESGQCFRIYKLSLQEQEKLCKSKGLENCESMAWYRVMAADKKVFVCQNGVHLIFFCSKEEYKQFWCHYFDLDFDYRSYEKAIDAYVADVVEQCEVDGVRRVLLVVAHEVEQGGVVVACERHCTVVLAYKASCLMETGGWKSGFACTDV